ncbi:transglutaminase family protein [Tuwongella immobilis]|uniref:Transglutaminase-like domain-containing protein n=1 Tax=Tuwongella immobilis TaxID=692036 RepID=A0A6C2YUU2_9BACT|nr:transglutaminase family protein [Tuwongella immobilis]VIP05127.1 Transglutaminase-like enzyme, predicted cysteine protease OS=Singulisphaera acidiphila (strain ATCC BAA-1392 / DSM 18658 / VKM B-2454 / MOB10) GN=Sinac_5793 PE=4 SV=1: Bact_transglu_N: Transglut_core [Tuwongella immobilis]VTS07610.1 Transglutaminase-like enzyme, predicted cysteine protease OS=Singulisphaera acidiphila (strain ATCC BAA-1392 / DSM 18658 / VKM B-2454 / MOB10) GN=Sinac_5793 PE=4 SV=1: Bact_transglu_N: Transglut_core 
MRMLRIDHETKLLYTQPIIESVVEVRMAPLSTEDQTVLGYKLRTSPTINPTTYRDGFGNRVELVTLMAAHAELAIRAASCVRVHRRSATERLAGVAWPAEPTASIDAMEYLRASPLVDFTSEIQAFSDSLPKPEGSFLQVVESLMHACRAALKYEKKVTEAHTPVSEALKLGCGVCQDFAHLFLATARLAGLPARYVSGYVHQPGELATHAWTQVWAGNSVGWVDIDPTQGKWVEQDHIVTAVGRDFSDVPPNRGVWKGNAQETINVTVNVQIVDRVPSDLSDHAQGPGWTSSGPGVPDRLGRATASNQQRKRQMFRQQQSQQQQ